MSEATPAPVSEALEITAPQPSQSQSHLEGGDKFASRFAALSKRERQIKEAEAKTKAEAGKYKKYEELSSKAKENPLDIIKEYGLSLDDLITASLGLQKPEPTVDDKVEQLRAEIRAKEEAKEKEELESKTKAEKLQQEAVEQAIVEHKGKIASHVEENKDKYELMSISEDAIELAWEVTETYYEANGELLTPEQASDKVENYLEEQAKKYLSLNKFKQKTEVKEESPMSFLRENPMTPRSSTLTSNLQAMPADKNKNMSIEDSKRAAAALIKWK